MTANDARAAGFGAAWTGGQWSFCRALFGAWLFLHYTQLLPWAAEVFSNAGMVGDAGASPLARLFPNVLLLCDDAWFVQALVAGAATLALLFAFGWSERVAALLLWYVGACLLGRNPLTNNPGLPFVGWLLLAHAAIPGRAFGSLGARGRIDPDGGWRLPPELFRAAWIVMAVGYSYSGITKLASPSWGDGSGLYRLLSDNPLARPTWLREGLLALPPGLLKVATWGALAAELAFAPLALFRRTRWIAWSSMLGMHLGLLTLLDFADLSLGMVMLHLFTFDPDWLPVRRGAAAREHLFFDGTCGLCHGFVRFVLAEDRHGLFAFSPLQGAAVRALIPDAERAALPDSVVVRRADGRLLIRSSVVIHIYDRLGGWWRALSWLMRVVPRPVRDLGYDLVAAVRYRVFSRPAAACPLLPPRLRARFLD